MDASGKRCKNPLTTSNQHKQHLVISKGSHAYLNKNNTTTRLQIITLKTVANKESQKQPIWWLCRLRS